jgi:mannosyl-3-phosphoglycerate phosphatase family protein
VSERPEAQFLVFTDLDGSLLDHHSYSYQDALPQLLNLERLGIPVIPVTSKTRVEIESLREELANGHPFIVENGAAVFIPCGYFEVQPAATKDRDGYWVREFSPPRQHWLCLLEALYSQFPDEFTHFQQAGTEGIVRMTGLSPDQARAANRREYSEPVQWLGSEQRRTQFIACLHEVGARVLQGGRFLSVSGSADKGKALTWLRAIYQEAAGGRPCRDLAVGDSPNDTAMLEAAEAALLIRTADRDWPVLKRRDGVIYSKEPGPAGWAEGVARWLRDFHIQP